jgi:hypothetical protein
MHSLAQKSAKLKSSLWLLRVMPTCKSLSRMREITQDEIRLDCIRYGEQNFPSLFAT